LGGVMGIDNGRWDALARRADRPDELVTVKLHPTAFDTLAPPFVVNRTRYVVGSMFYDSLILTVEPDLDDDEAGPYAQRRLRDDVYPLLCRQPLEEAVLFESWSGKQYSDSPRAIYEELLRRGDSRRHTWVIRGPVPDIPGDPQIVRLGSRAHFEAAARAKYVVDNDVGPKWFRTRADGQRYLQTWHGTPLKRIGFDIERIQFKSSNYLDVLADEVPNWSYLV